MTTRTSRLELLIDVLDVPGQRALAAADLLPRQLIQAVLDEFRELEYLGCQAQAYGLAKLPDGTPLAEDEPIGSQLVPGDRLALLETKAALPSGAVRPSRPVYIRALGTDQVVRLHWMPAIVGRSSESQPGNALVAVDLQSFPGGERVSRRHVQITEQGERFLVENLSKNPAVLLPESPLREEKEGGPLMLTETPRLLLSGDVIRLERSGVKLRFIVHDLAAPAVEPETNEP